jgi:MFS family permease
MPGLLRENRDFSLLWIGQLASQMGTKIHLIALSWYFVNVLNDNTGLVLMLLAGALPMFIVGPLAGPLIDRLDKRWLMIGSDVASAIITAGIAMAVKFNGGTAWISALVFLLGAAQVFFGPAARSLIPRLVGESRLQEATSLYTMVYYISLFTGAAAGGLLVGFMGVLSAVLFNAASFMVSASTAALMEYPVQKPIRGPGYIREIREGIGFIASHPAVLRLLVTCTVFNIFLVSMVVYLPIMIDDYLGMGASAFGIAEALLPAGSMAAALLLAHFTVVDSIGWIRFCITFSGGAFLLAAFGRTYPFILTTMFLLGGLVNAVSINAVSWFTKNVTPDLHGRFFSIQEVTGYGTFPLAYLAAGVVIRRFDVFDILMVNGVLVTALGLAGLILFKRRSNGAAP